MKADVISILQELNFTEYEAKAYLALLEKSPLTGYAISLNSGVPRSKIYEVLNGMVARGDVLVSQESTPLYIPLSPEELIAQRKRDAEKTYLTAQKKLKQYTVTSQNRENIWNISGHEAILARVKEEIKEAKHRVLLEVWSDDVMELREELEQAARRDVKVFIISYGELNFEFATVYQHYMPEEITDEYGGRWIVSSVDDREIVAGIVSLGKESRAAWTAHPGLVMPITEVIIHDIYIMEIMNVFRNELEAKFGPNLINLRNKFTLEPYGKKYYLAIQQQN
ncbi:hypothetical protein SRRS_18100 [Sporomusa rhizae]|uniref:TrmB family transcriptional regulator n=1 Tax=Sporomusa rhizae TaxID=357999 RepID=UPI00352B5792